MANMHLITGYAGTEHIRSADEGALNAAILGNTQAVLAKGNQLSASAISNNTVRVLDGDIIMQGRHIRLNENTYVDLTIDSGEQGLKRNDLIVARYTKNATTAVEEVNLVVIKGTASESEPSDPAYTMGDILNEGAALNDMPLYRVQLDGINMADPVQLFTLFTATLGDVAAVAGSVTSLEAAMTTKQDKIRQVTVSLSATWTGEASPYSQAVTISGVAANTQVDLKPSPTQITSLMEMGCTGLQAVNVDGAVTVYALGEKPTEAMDLQADLMGVTV